MDPRNQQLASLFEDMAFLHAYLNGGNRFRSLAYTKAAKVLSQLEDDLSVYTEGELDQLEGIGKGIASKILEFYATGHLSKHADLLKKVPSGTLEFKGIEGLGPRTLRMLHGTFGFRNVQELLSLIEKGELAKFKGFGPKKIANLKKNLQRHMASRTRISLWEAMEIGNEVLAQLQGREIARIQIAGSIRRCSETIGDIDIVVACPKAMAATVIDRFVTIKGVGSILAKGTTKASLILEGKNRQVDLRVVEEDQWGAALLYFTGSKEHNIRMRYLAKRAGMKLNEYGLFSMGSGNKIAGVDEQGIYGALHMEWIPPELRENQGEIEEAQQGKLPELVTLGDIKGDLHIHTTGPHGAHSVETIARHIQQHYAYQYIAITDHVKGTGVPHGLTEGEFLAQMDEIKRINGLLGSHFIKTGAQVGIREDGSLDLSDEVVQRLDWVIATLQSGFNRDNTDRLIKACEHSHVHMIGNPTGRILGHGRPYGLDMEAVLDAAAATGTALEINAQPHRMDLSCSYITMAREMGVKLVIGTDSHNLKELAYMQLGIGLARRARCAKDALLNTLPWTQLSRFKTTALGQPTQL